ncbi:hypothetical protein MAPG_09232 [Magnaporthiopsis poae ATCC 64411]|uniref:RTA1 domain-containing protein n=1 Tax=Magnaporthiopsis poae (strain ATCC 64411 / 73-15) TaxID=644358 RepID=A0A0C4E9E8_MAGP6|nr:hypothetical protein MAPG_09232 [Magnaporthiopsis poae ATCC 64411]
MPDGSQAPRSLFFYTPSTAAAAVFTAAYALLTLGHLYLTWKYKSWTTSGMLPFTALAFTAGFAVRVFCSFHDTHAKAFIATQFILYATAPLLELANAHILGRILYYVPYLSPIHPGRVLSSFLMLSFSVEILNALGVMQSIVGTIVQDKAREDAASRVKTGNALMKASLILQLSFALLLVGLGAVFQFRCFRRGIRTSKVNMPLLGVYLSMLLVTARTVYRTVEHFAFENLTAASLASSMPPVVLRFEWYFYVFEAAVLFLAVAVFVVLHPRRWLPLHKTTYLAQDGVTELEGPGWNDKRPFIVTLCDPFNLVGLLSRTPRGANGGDRPFWESNGYVFKKGPGRSGGESTEEGLGAQGTEDAA